MVSDYRALVQALSDTLVLLREGYVNDLASPLDDEDVRESLGRASVMFENSAVTLINWLEVNCPELGESVAEAIADSSGE